MCGLLPWVREIFGSDVWKTGFDVLWSLHLEFTKTMLLIDSLWWALAVYFNIFGAA